MLKKSKRKLVLLIVLILSVNALAACSNNQSSSENVLRIGVVGPESGGSAQLGQGQRRAIELAISEINENKLAGEWTLEAFFEDDEGNPTKSSSATNKLIQESKTHVVIAAINSSATLADMVVTERAGIPQITPGSTGASITEQGNEWIFRTAANDAFQADALIKYAKEELGLTKLATFTSADDYGQSGAKLLKNAIEKYGLELVDAPTYNNGDKDFKPQLISIKEKGAQAIFLWGLYTEAALISNQVQQLGIDVQLFGASGMASAKLIELGGDAAQGLILTQTFLPDADIPKVKEFVEKYKEKYNESPIPHGAQAYDTVYIIADAVRKANSSNPKDLRDALRKTEGLELVTGNPAFNEQGDDIGKRLLITEIRGNEFKLIKAVENN
ncbi:ABC transporter substrate-binding protein [Tissierella carlieri]|uniref:ABC transporter substrate-binding protein n=1 Tax=Tissierella carlieri TaxID=689904 RepID=A0ABT1SBQ0_9FIRM|nr:ABC transporter substrate-binding protein [Tissierella carlieri]MBU5313223.1 ABC transporter substrate-binding protein [Tissierella carlieri]MCQ4923921.1 ABC transporter substrate-binding protein [Tissierella carlieri]MDU5082568.1 ABC transporter substrate-binding protein [Bacillota bacterium]